MLKLTLTKDKVTPGTVRYKEVVPNIPKDDAPEGYRPITIYLPKELVRDTLDNAETITMVIEKES